MKATVRAQCARSITGKCEIILCEDAVRRGKALLFIELTPEGLADHAARGRRRRGAIGRPRSRDE